MPRFDELAAFVAVVRARGFTKAAAQLGVSQSALSQTVRTLEKRLDLKLLNRTTRSVSPTEAGERLYQTVEPRFAEIDAELAVLGEMRGQPSGTVRITATEHAVRVLVWPRLVGWLAKYPGIKVEVNSNNRFVDIVADRYDIGVRLGADVAKDMIAVRMSSDMRMIVVGSPKYLTGQPKPSKPQDLPLHDCIGMRLPTHGDLMTWDFQRRGKKISVHVTGRLTFGSSDLIVSAALAGFGLCWVPEDMVSEHLAKGRLEQVLADWTVTLPGYHLYYASPRASSALNLVVAALRMPTDAMAPSAHSK
jgi:DNA-binding transcriptional LysR family regulator